jgi:hypothetical protein
MKLLTHSHTYTNTFDTSLRTFTHFPYAWTLVRLLFHFFWVNNPINPKNKNSPNYPNKHNNPNFDFFHFSATHSNAHIQANPRTLRHGSDETDAQSRITAHFFSKRGARSFFTFRSLFTFITTYTHICVHADEQT